MNENPGNMQEEERQVRDALDGMLRDLYAGADVPRDVNIRLYNRITQTESVEEGGVPVWWLPASLSTLTALIGMVFSVLLYCLVNYLAMDFAMPYLLEFVTGALLKMELAAAVFQAVISWLITFVSIWKLDFYQCARF